jgi:hypothetical protein
VQELSLNGIDLAYIERGQGQPVLFVHAASAITGTGSGRSKPSAYGTARSP